MNRTTALRAACAALIVLASAGRASWAQLRDSDQAWQRDALAHAQAIEQAYRRLEHHIRQASTSATSWQGSTPPAGTGWRSSWTERGVRARYCDSILLVYLSPAAVKGVGEDHRAVHVAPRLYAPVNRGQAPTLHWLESDVAEGGPGRQTVTMPACMTAPGFGPLPSGRAALAGRVEDPWATTRDRESWEVRAHLTCPTGFHRPPRLSASKPARKERRRVTQAYLLKRDADGNRIPSGDPTYGAWTELYSLCRADYEEPETDIRACTYAGPAGQTVSGYEIWRRRKMVSASADGMGIEEGGAWSLSRSTCTGTPGPVAQAPAGTPEAFTFTTRTVNVQETRSSSCPPGETGTYAYETRWRTDEIRRFVWPDGRTDEKRRRGISYTNWIFTSDCAPPPPPPPPPPPDDPPPPVDQDDPNDPNAGDDPNDDTSDPPDDDDGSDNGEDQAPEDEATDGSGEPGDDGGSDHADADGDGLDENVDFDDNDPDVGNEGTGGFGGETIGTDDPEDGATDDGTESADDCFLTTAIVEFRGTEGDSGPTLTKLRQFRDGFMMETSARRALVARYYDLAPRITAAIPDDHPDWQWIGERIDHALAAIDAGDDAATLAIYRHMVNELTSRWLTQEGDTR